MEVTIEKGKLIISLPINKPLQKSASGKTLVVASSRGNKETDAIVDGKKVIVGVNAYVYPTDKE